jgi:hypothetical protein
LTLSKALWQAHPPLFERNAGDRHGMRQCIEHAAQFKRRPWPLRL